MKLPPGLACLLLLVVLSACAQTSGILSGSGDLTVDPADPCRQQRQSFAQGQNYFAQAIFTKATQSAASAGMPSLLSGNVSTAFSSALSGGISGIKAGYWNALQQQNADKQQLTQSINGDLRRESLAIDHTTAAFATLRSCRVAQATRIKAAARSGRIDNAEARRELKQEHDWFTEEIAAAQNAGINMQKRDDQFAYAADSLRKEDAAASKSVTTTATETIPQKRNSFESSVKEAQAQSTSAFSLDANAAAKERRYA